MRSIRKHRPMEFDISYASKEITPWGGMVFLKQMLHKIAFREHINSCVDLPQPNSNRGHKVSTIIEVFRTNKQELYHCCKIYTAYSKGYKH